MAIKIIHIIPDSPFTDMLHRIFELTHPGKNEYLIIHDSRRFKYIKEFEPKVVSKYSLLSKQYIKNVFKADIIVFHSLNSWNLRILDSLPSHIKTIWIGWGFDYYDLIDLPQLKSRTKSISPSSTIENTNWLKSKIKSYIFPSKHKVLSKIDIFSPVLYEDFELVKLSMPDFSPKYVSWNYGTLEDDLVKGFRGKYIVGNNILLGNSASHTNNHLDAFDILEKINLSNRKVITPLSYGENDYKVLIAAEGRRRLGDNFEPLVEFIPIEEYIAKLQSCSIVIMNHLRQQAVGNIVIALYLGAKVFLDKRNPVYPFFINAGAHIYSIDDLRYELDTPLVESQIEKNREVLSSHWGREVIIEKTSNLIKTTLAITK